jgi:hypothetical protein
MIQLTIDAKHVLRKWSTWLAAASASSTAAMLAYAQLPTDVQTAFPHWILTALGIVAVASAGAIPIATSIQQSNIPTEPQP